MRGITITDYVRTFENPHGVFRTLGEVAVERDIYGEIRLRAGNSAAVFTYAGDAGRRFLKCYVRPNTRLSRIYGYIERNRPTLLPESRMMPGELYVRTISGEEGWVDVAEGAWFEGETLDTVIAGAAKSGDAERLGRAAADFDALCGELFEQEWAHGDLKPENIVVGGDGKMTLIDCDAMWIPDFAGLPATELGTPAYRHPGRGAAHFDKYIDDYPAMLISTSLHALALDTSLFSRYNTTDNIIFSPAELTSGVSEAFGEVAELFARNAMARELRMLEACCSPFPVADASAAGFFAAQPGGETRKPVSFACGGKWGFAGENGNIVVSPFWDEALDFRGGVSAVRLGKWWHTIDLHGNIVRRGLTHDEMKAAR